MVRMIVVDFVEGSLPLAKIAQHLRCRFARPVVQHLVGFSTARIVIGGQHKFLVLKKEQSDDGDLHRIAETAVLVDQRHLQARKKKNI